MSKISEENLDLSDLRKFEVEVQEWIIQNASIIIESYLDYTSFTTTLEEPQEDPLTELKQKAELENKIKDIIDKVSIEKIPYIFHRIITILAILLKNKDIQKSIILNTITQIYIAVLLDLKVEDAKYSSLEPYQQFLPETFDFIANQISNDNNLIDIIDEDYWKDIIFENIIKKEENKLLRYSLRSLILYCKTIRNRKRRLKNLKK